MKPTTIVLLAQHFDLFKRCLSSIQLYTPELVELVVINDGDSPDITRWAEQFRSAPIRVLSSPAIAGVAAGFNRGAAVATGERIVFIRDHIIVSEHWLERLSAALDANPNAAAAGRSAMASAAGRTSNCLPSRCKGSIIPHATSSLPGKAQPAA